MPTPTTWTPDLLRDPHHTPDKRARVQKMFAAIAPSYDLNNRLHSLWMDQRWRRKAVQLASVQPHDTLLDVACGTGDLTLAFAQANPPPATLLGLDFTYQMLPLARSKYNKGDTAAFLPSGPNKGDTAPFPPAIRHSQSPISYINADALSLPLPSASCDVLSIAFGIRNITDPLAALKEFRRVLRPNGRLIILEFSLPTNPLLKTLYNVYFRQILPRTATLISRDKTGAYKYLPESVNTFITPSQMQDMMTTAGFTQITQHPLTFGICICYRGLVPV